MIALLKIIRKVFLSALVLAGSIPFVSTHWMPCLGMAPAVFVLTASPVASHPGTHPEQTARHGLCWRAEVQSPRAYKAFTPAEFAGTGKPMAFRPGHTPIPPYSDFSCRAPALLSILRI